MLLHREDVMRALGDAGSSATIDIVLEVLGERLTPMESAAVARSLDGSLRRPLLAANWAGDFDTPTFYVRIAERSGLALPLAREQTDVVLHMVGGALSDEALRLVERGLPPELFLALTERELGEVPPHAAVRGHTLATGKPGSAHPVAESSPPGAQSHSVIREDNPHAETKLSSSRGLTQQRLEDSVASGKPENRPISESRGR